MERGHTEADAERLWDVLNEAIDVDGAEEPGGKSMLTRAGKAFLEALTPGSDDGADVTQSPEAPDNDADKEGRTLSRQNRESLYATIDASLDVLQDAGVNHGMTRFTDREDTTFDLSEHNAREWTNPDDEEDEDEDEDEDDATDAVPDSVTESAPDGDTSAESTMSNEDDETEPPEWAKELQEQIDKQSKRIDEALDADEEEKDEDEEKDAWEDAPEWATDLKADVDEQAERIDDISKQTGTTESQQLAGGENSSDGGLDDSQKFFIPASKRGGL